MNCFLRPGWAGSVIQVHLPAEGGGHRRQSALWGRRAAPWPQGVQHQSGRRLLLKSLRRKFDRDRWIGTENSGREISERRFAPKRQTQSEQSPVQVVRPDHRRPQLQPLLGFLRPPEQGPEGSRLVRCNLSNLEAMTAKRSLPLTNQSSCHSLHY